jgi:hypothetical protein
VLNRSTGVIIYSSVIFEVQLMCKVTWGNHGNAHTRWTWVLGKKRDGDFNGVKAQRTGGKRGFTQIQASD